MASIFDTLEGGAITTQDLINLKFRALSTFGGYVYQYSNGRSYVRANISFKKLESGYKGVVYEIVYRTTQDGYHYHIDEMENPTMMDLNIVLELVNKGK